MLVAGRSPAKADAFCRTLPGLIPVVLDRENIAEALIQHSPDVVVDTSGPFQEMDLTIPRACIAAGVHYCDIADSRAFVEAMADLDTAAREAGVAMLSGASSVPALSGAVVASLSGDMENVTAVEMAISASNQAAAGTAVAAAILGQVGKPFTLRRGGRTVTRYGWQEIENLDFEVPGLKPLIGRRVALADVPDIALLPDRLPGCPAVAFRAGTELGFQNWALWLLSWVVRWGWLSGLTRLRGWLLPLQRLTAKFGSDRSAMSVRLFGEANNLRVERRWTLIADQGDGPEIPTLAVPLIIARIIGGNERSGARDAGQALTLTDFEPAFSTLAISHASTEHILPDPLYRRVMGDRFDRLPPAVRRMHDVVRDGGASGEAEVIGATNALGRLVARIMRFPRAGKHELHVAFTERDGRERWVRQFGEKAFASSLSSLDGALVEQFGPLRFAFDLPGDDHGLEMVMTSWAFGLLPLPLILAPRSRAREWEDLGRFNFDVPIELPLIGRIVHYRGWLVPC